MCQRFELILSHNYDASAIGRRIKGLPRDERIKLVGDALGGKANSTLKKRISQARDFLLWCVGQEMKAFPIDAQVFEGYTEALGDAGASYSKLMGVFEIVRFLQHVLGVEVDPNALTSPTIKGRLRKARLNRAPRRQARPLATNEILWLEAFLADPNRSLLDRYAVGCFLMAVYSCARLGDLKVVSDFRLDLDGDSDVGYLELYSLSHKARAYGNAMGLRMPMVAPVKGMGPGCWGRTFVSVAASLGRPLESLASPGPLLTAPVHGGAFSCSWIGNSRWTAWIRSIVALGTPGQVPHFTGHSAKATILSWRSKYGICEEARSVLGHHALPARSVVTYSRELLAAPLRQLASVLKAVENGSFRPDCTRSGMILDLQRPASSEAAGAQVGDGAAQCESNDKAVPAQDASDHDADEAGAPLEPAKGSEVEPQGSRWMDPASCTDKARAKPSTCFPEAAASRSLCVAGPRHQTTRSCAPW